MKHDPGPKPGYRQSPEHVARRTAGKTFWTGERIWAVMGDVDHGLDDAEIAARLGVTAEAVRVVRVRNGIRCVRSHYLSARDVARLLGVDDHAVSRWIRHGWLRAKRGKAPGGWKAQWYILRRSVDQFLNDERYWHVWKPERITDPDLRRRMLALRGDVRFLTVGEVADRMFVVTSTVNGWINKGYLPARKYGNWWVDSRDLARFELPPIGGQRWKVRTTNDE